MEKMRLERPFPVNLPGKFRMIIASSLAPARHSRVACIESFVSRDAKKIGYCERVISGSLLISRIIEYLDDRWAARLASAAVISLQFNESYKLEFKHDWFVIEILTSMPGGPEFYSSYKLELRLIPPRHGKPGRSDRAV
jgi:hypothetical protein